MLGGHRGAAICFALALACSLGCPTPDPGSRRPVSPQLAPGGWHPANREALQTLVDEMARAVEEGGPPPLAVFDWDDTSICADAGDATFRYLLDEGRLALSEDQLAELIPDAIDGQSTLGGHDLAALREELLADYRALRVTGSIERSGGHRIDFRARLAWLYGALLEQHGARVAYPWLTRLLAGFTEEELRVAVGEAIRRSVSEPIGQQNWGPTQEGVAGRPRVPQRMGLRAQPELIDLMRAMQLAGAQVYIVSASQETVVEIAAEELGYPVPASRIFGMRLAQDESGRFTTELLPGWPVTWRQGKVELIERELPGRPWLVAGDSATDLEMLTAFPETRVRLLFNRNKQDEVRALYAQAFDAASRPLTLLQGRDENQCRLHPVRETIPAGATEPVALPESAAN